MALCPCKHCNGTTFCSAVRDATGKLKTRPACVCCLARAGLDPKGLYDKVICSVCEGKGVVEPVSDAPPKRSSPGWYWWVVAPLLPLALVFFAFSAVYYYREQHKYEDSRDVLAQQAGDSSAIRRLPLSAVQSVVRNGMTKAEVREQLGEPTSVASEALEVEVWSYRCKDGYLRVSFTNETVQGVH